MNEHIDEKYDPFKIGVEIRKIRLKNSLAIKVLSNLTKISYTKLSYLENGLIKKIKNKDIELICAALNIQTDEILNVHTKRDNNEDINLITELELIEAFIKINKPLVVKDRITRLLRNNYDKHKYKNTLYRILGDYHSSIEQYHIAISIYERINYDQIYKYNIDHEILRTEISYINAIHKNNDTETAIFKYKLYLERLDKIENQEEITEYKVITYYNLTLIYLHMYQFNKAKLFAINGNEYNRACPVPHVHFDYILAIVLYLDENWNEAVSSIKRSFTKLRYEENKNIVLKSLTLLYYIVMNHPVRYNYLFQNIEDEILNSIVTCDDDCKNYSHYHLVINEYIASLIQKKDYPTANDYIEKMYEMDHCDDYTRYLRLKLNLCVDNDKATYLNELEKLIINLSNNLGEYEKSIITLAYMQETAMIPLMSNNHIKEIKRFIETNTGIHNKMNFVKMLPELLG